jgi:transposase
LNSKLHAVCDGNGRPLVMLLSEGRMSDYKGAALVLSAMPKAKQLLADKGYDADWFRAALAKRPITPAFLPKPTAKPRSRMTPPSTNSAIRSKTCSGASKTGGASIPDTAVCAHAYFSAICIAAAVIFWL